MDRTDRILIVDDETIALDNLSHVFTRAGCQVEAAASGERALELLGGASFDVVLTDLRMPGIDGISLLRRIREQHPATEVIVITAFASPNSAVEAMRAGAFYYVEKPFRLDEVRKVVGEALEKVRLKRENRNLREQVALQEARREVVSEDEEFLAVLRTAVQVAPRESSVLVVGETGTGKEVVARLLHRSSPRAGAPFVAVNCGAFNEELLASELFGHVRGSFTGAVADKAGLFEAARGGTLFLDEVTEMPLPMQVKLLRVLQEREVLRVGATRPVPVDVRIVAATNRDIDAEVAAGRFRQDLYYRVNVVTLSLPPLRRRTRDIPLLAQHFLHRYRELMQRDIRGFSASAMDALQRYGYPGNIRELENIVERGVAIAPGAVIEAGDLPAHVLRTAGGFEAKGQGEIEPLAEIERRYIEWALQACDGNQQVAARRLGIDRTTLWRKLKRYDTPDGGP